MKRTLALIVALLMLAAICAIPAAAADRTEVAGYYEYSATKNEEILSGEAGEASMKWNVPYQAIAPVIDGVINQNEYARFENFEYKYICLIKIFVFSRFLNFINFIFDSLRTFFQISEVYFFLFSINNISNIHHG